MMLPMSYQRYWVSTGRAGFDIHAVDFNVCSRLVSNAERGIPLVESIVATEV